MRNESSIVNGEIIKDNDMEETDEKSKNRPAGAWNRRRRSV